MVSRLILLSVLFLSSAGYFAHATRAEQVPPRVPLSQLPLKVADWQGRETGRFTPDIERMLGVDEYVTRAYAVAKEPAVSIYVGYYESQRQGDAIHSPLNCLPGAGWQPVRSDRVDIPIDAASGTIHVNRYIVQKGMDRQLVLYWYQSHGRVVASEYWSKAFIVYDAMRLNRTDAALVRVMSPVLPAEADDAAAGERVTRFVRDFYPLLARHLPS